MACQVVHIVPQVNDGLHCKCCSSVYIDPRILSCLHSFCLQCLTNKDITNNSIACPSCNHRSLLPIRGDVASLPVNLRLACEVERNAIFTKVLATPPKVCESCEDEESLSVAYCKDCNDLLCADCWKVHRKRKATKTHTVHDLDELKMKRRGELVRMIGPSVDSVPNCQHHHKQSLSFYCHNDGCRVPICVECAIDRHDKTKRHDVREINGHVDIEQIATNLKVKTQELRRSKGNLDTILQQIKETKKKVENCKDEVAVCIRSKFKELHRAIEIREKKLLEENTKIANSKLMHLSTQNDGINHLVQSIDSCVSMTTSATDEYSTVQLLAVANTLSKRAEELQKQYNATHLDLVDTPNIDVVIYNHSPKQKIAECGKFLHRNADGTQCSAILPRHTLGLGTTMNVKVVTRNSLKQCLETNHRGSTKVKAKLLCDGKVISDYMAVTDQGNGTFLVHVTSTCNSEGNHKLSIAVNGLDIQGSPFDVMVVPRRDYTGLDRPVHTISGIPKPRYIAFAGNGDMYVTSDGDHRIHVYDRNGVKETTTIGSGKGSGRTQFDSPYGIDIHGDVVYVADYGNHRIQQLTTGKRSLFTHVHGERGSGCGQFNGPHDVKFNPVDGKVYVADTDNDRVQVFNPADFSISHVIDGTERNFSRPIGIAFDLSGNVCISAYRSKAVLVFNTKGGFVRRFSVNHPAGIAVDAFGNYFISCDAKFTLFENMVLQVFEANGTVSFTGKDTNYSGHGIAVSPHDNAVWITDKDANKVMKLKA